MRTFIHYGSPNYDRFAFMPIKNQIFEKPTGGLWASDLHADYGWKDFCLAEEYKVESLKSSFTFSLKKDTKILHLEEPEDFCKLPIRWNDFMEYDPEFFSQDYYEHDFRCYFSYQRTHTFIDWEKLSKEYDAVEYIRTPWNHDVLYTWDVDSILIFNPDVIIPN